MHRFPPRSFATPPASFHGRDTRDSIAEGGFPSAAVPSDDRIEFISA